MSLRTRIFSATMAARASGHDIVAETLFLAMDQLDEEIYSSNCQRVSVPKSDPDTCQTCSFGDEDQALGKKPIDIQSGGDCDLSASLFYEKGIQKFDDSLR